MHQNEGHDGRSMRNIESRIGLFSKLAFDKPLLEQHMLQFSSYVDGNKHYNEEEVSMAMFLIDMQSKEKRANLITPDPISKSLAAIVKEKTYFFSQYGQAHMGSAHAETKPFFDFVFQLLYQKEHELSTFSNTAEALFGFILYHEEGLDFRRYRLSIEASGIRYKPESYSLLLTFENRPKILTPGLPY